jgi:hypothetical protein
VTTSDTFATDQPITGGGIRSVNFFNGRLLTGEDMTREQQANLLGRLRLGRAVGSGVASGLEVSVAAASTNDRPVVRVEGGLAVNRVGRVLELVGATDIALTQERADGSGADMVFEDCTPIQPGTYTAGAGVYLFTIAEAAAGEGRAKVSGLGNEDAACNIAFSIEGVQFHLLRLALPSSFLATTDRLRNRVAHLMLGTADTRRTAFARNPFGPPLAEYGLLDDLHASGCLGDEHVPLAVLAWTPASGIRFVDLWAVRRRVVAPAGDRLFPLLVGDRRQAESEAMFLQFQAQIADLLAAGGGLGTLTAAERFEFLPPVGMVPITGANAPVGFDPDTFLGDQGSQELATTDAALLPALVHESLGHDPIEVDGGERVQRYVIWDNELEVEAGNVGRRVLVFAKRTLPYRGIARYGRAQFGRSRFAPSVI